MPQMATFNGHNAVQELNVAKMLARCVMTLENKNCNETDKQKKTMRVLRFLPTVKA